MTINNVLGIEVKKRLQDIEDIKYLSAEAQQRSLTAEEKARLAELASTLTREQLKAALDDGDQLQEVLMLRVDPETQETFDTAADMFAANQRKVSSQLAQTSHNLDSISLGTGVIPEMFPTLPNEINDFGRLKRAIEYCRDNNIKKVFLNNDLVVDQTIEVDASYLSFHSATISDSRLKIKADKENFSGDCLIHVKSPGASFQDIGLIGDNNTEMTSGVLTAIKYDFEQPDLDSYITGCSIQYFLYGIVSYGRNLRIEDKNLFSHVNFPISLHKHLNGGMYGNDLRGIRIDNNLFHSVGGEPLFDDPDFACLLTINDCTPRQDILFVNNLIEQGVRRLFKGYYYGLHFKDNHCQIASPMPYAMELFDTPKEINVSNYSVISGNHLRGGTLELDTFQETKNFVKANNLKYCIIDDNIFNGSTNEAILIEGIVENSFIIKNKIRFASYQSPSQYDSIKIGSIDSVSKIYDNDFIGGRDKHNIYIDSIGEYKENKPAYPRTYQHQTTISVPAQSFRDIRLSIPGVSNTHSVYASPISGISENLIFNTFINSNHEVVIRLFNRGIETVTESNRTWTITIIRNPIYRVI